MRNLISFAFSFLFVSAISHAQPINGYLDVPAALKAIKAYEAQFDSVRVVWTEATHGFANAMDGELVLDKGKKYRKTALRITGEPERFNIASWDGATFKMWTRMADEESGSIVIQDGSPDTLAHFQEYLFRPHASDHVAAYRTIEIKDQTDARVAIRFTQSESFYIDAEYRRDGDFLKVIRYQYHPIENGKVLDGTEFRYEYADDTAGPTQIEQVSVIHGVHETLTIKSMDFHPTVSPTQFELATPEGVDVRDLRTTESK